MTEETEKALKKIFVIKWIIYFALVMSIFFYFIICVILKKNNIQLLDDPKLVVFLSNLLGGIAAALLFIAFFIRKNNSNPEKFLNMVKRRDMNPELGKMYAQKLDDETGKRIGVVILLSNTIDIVSWMLCESVAIFGVVLFFLSGDILYTQAFGGVALLALAFTRPNFANFINIAGRALEGTGEAQ